MRNKNIFLMVLSALVLVVVMGFGSAAFVFNNLSGPGAGNVITSISDTIVAGEATSVTFDFNLENNDPVNDYANMVWTIQNEVWTSSLPTQFDKGTWSLPTSFTTLAKISNQNTSVTLNNIPYNFVGTINGEINITGDYSGTPVSEKLLFTITVSAPAYSFCSSGSDSNDLELKVDIKNKGQGNDDEWLPLDTIEVEVDFDNDRDSNGDDLYDMEDVTFELGLFKVGSTSNVAEDMIWISQDEQELEFGDVNEGDDAKHTFEFRVDPEDIDDGDYILMVKAYPAGDESTDCIGYSADLSSSEFGVSVYYAEISVEKESDKDKMVIIDTENLPKPATASCEQEVTFTADVWNIGDVDFEDRIMVTLINTELGINKQEVLTGDLDAGEKTQVTFVFDVPEGATEKIYTLSMQTNYDYDEDDNEYNKQSDEIFTMQLDVSGNCVVPKASVSATLESGGKAGEPLVVKTTVTNTGTESTTYTFSVAGYSEWASSAVLSNSTLTLGAGESKEITITLDVKTGISGEQTFNLETSAGGKIVSTQPIQSSIEGKTGLNLKDNESLVAILIALISAIIIAIIIVLIVRAAKR